MLSNWGGYFRSSRPLCHATIVFLFAHQPGTATILPYVVLRCVLVRLWLYLSFIPLTYRPLGYKLSTVAIASTEKCLLQHLARHHVVHPLRYVARMCTNISKLCEAIRITLLITDNGYILRVGQDIGATWDWKRWNRGVPKCKQRREQPHSDSFHHSIKREKCSHLYSLLKCLGVPQPGAHIMSDNAGPSKAKINLAWSQESHLRMICGYLLLRQSSTMPT